MTHEEVEAAIERLRSMRIVNRNLITEVCRAFLGGELTGGDALHYTLIELLEQADPDTHTILPVDADGVPIHIGDELISKHSKKTFVVTRLQYSRKHAWMVGGADKDELSKYGLYAPRETRHYQPTVEDVLFEFGKICQDGYDIGNNIHEYAAKLRELMADD